MKEKMTKIKLCGLSRPEDIVAANELKPDFIGFVFAPKSKRFVSPEKAMELKRMLDPDIQAVGVFVNSPLEYVAGMLDAGIIDLAQLHGNEDEDYIEKLQQISGKPVVKAFTIQFPGDRFKDERQACKSNEAILQAAMQSPADYILLDSGAGTGRAFNWELIRNITRPYFLAGGLDPENVQQAIESLHPFAVDVSSGIETDGVKDRGKMSKFVERVFW